MTTLAQVKMCSHLANKEQSSRMVYAGKWWCLDCIAAIFERTKEPRLQAGWLIGRHGAKHK